MHAQRLLTIVCASCYCAANASAQAQPYVHVGSASSENYGFSVARAGDFDLDGVQDLIVGSPYSSLGGPVTGMAQVFSGRDGSVLHTWLGTTSGTNFGESVSAAGDANNDGIDDVVVGEPGASPGGHTFAGLTHVYSGSTGTLLWSRSGAAFEASGRAVAGGLDVDLDGYDDVIVGATGGNGKVRVYTGDPGTLITTIHTFLGDAPADFFGRAVAAAGDLDGDGYGDILVGAPLNDANGTAAGLVRAFSGRTGGTSLAWTWLGDSAADGLGEAVAGAGDVDGDGFDDVIAGAPYDDDLGSEAGLARIWNGRTGATIRTLYGDATWKYFGISVAGLGDLDGDGKNEVAVGSTSGSGTYTYGAVRVFTGASGATLFTLYGDPLGAFHFGRALSPAGDLNGDGKVDLIVGSEEDSVSTGSARVFLSDCFAPVTYCSAKVNSLGCPPAITHSGAPSLTIADAFTLGGTNVLNNKFGVFFFGLAAATIPFGGGTLCVAPPIIRTPVQSSGGTPPPAGDCSGNYSFHFSHAYMVSKGLTAGTAIFGQYWSRDPGYAPPNNIGLTDAVHFEVLP